MKKIILMIIGVVTIVSNSIAQDAATAQENITDLSQKLMFGLKIGGNYSNVYDTKSQNFQADPKLGFAAGGFVAIPIGKYLGIQPELLFSQRGFQSTGTIFGSSYGLTRTTNYIDIPLLVAFKPTEFITLLAGPQYSYLIKQRDVFSTNTSSIVEEQSFENNNLRRNTLCFTGGLDFTHKHFVVSLRAGWDLLNNNGDGSSTNPQYKNVWYQATIGYRFY